MPTSCASNSRASHKSLLSSRLMVPGLVAMSSSRDNARLTARQSPQSHFARLICSSVFFILLNPFLLGTHTLSRIAHGRIADCRTRRILRRPRPSTPHEQELATHCHACL